MPIFQPCYPFVIHSISIRMTYENDFCIRKGRFHEAPLQIIMPWIQGATSSLPRDLRDK